MPRGRSGRRHRPPAGQAAPPSRLAEPTSVQVKHAQGGPARRSPARRDARARRGSGRRSRSSSLPRWCCTACSWWRRSSRSSTTACYKWNGLASPTNFVGLDNFSAPSRRRVHGALSTTRSSSCSRSPSSCRSRWGSPWCSTQRLKGRALLRMLFFAPFVLSEVVTGRRCSPDPPAQRARRPVLDAAGLPRHQWLADPTSSCTRCSSSSPGSTSASTWCSTWPGCNRSQRTPRGRRDRRRDFAGRRSATSRCRCSDRHPDLRLPVDHRGDPAVRPGVGDDRRRPGGRVEDDGDLHVRLGFKRFEFGYASAVAVIMLMISLAIAPTYERFVLRRDLQGATTTMGR